MLPRLPEVNMSQRTRVVLGPAKPGNNQPAYPKLRIFLVLSLLSSSGVCSPTSPCPAMYGMLKLRQG